MKNKLTEKDCDIICDALDYYVTSDNYSGIFSDDEVEKTFYKVQDLWQKITQERKKTSWPFQQKHLTYKHYEKEKRSSPRY